MFTDFLNRAPMETLLLEQARRLYPPAEDRQAWDGIPPAGREEIRKLAAEWAAVPYPVRSAGGFLAFVRSGDRQADEIPYFTRRRKLCAAVLGCCVFPENDLSDVVDGIWLICEESSWVISAHNVNPIPGAPLPAEYPLPDIRKPYVDLFSAQTGMILSLTAMLLGNRLDGVSTVLRERIRDEIRHRILVPFMSTDDFWWMGVKRKDLNNWTPWILSNIMVCATLDPMPETELAGVLTRACEMLDRYLDCLPDDGGCDEGAGYWNMAGGALLDCLMLLEQVSGGRMAFWENDKLRNILSYPLKASLGNGWFINFADCDARPFLSGERLETAGIKISDPVLRALGTRMRGTVKDQLSDVPHLTRALDLLFHPPGEPAEAAEPPKDIYLPDLQLRVVRRAGWTLACKGGHNGENHNHNDVGSFILMLDGEPAVVDAGNMIYTAKTFSDERYTLWNVRAGWHNLPIIGEAEQREGMRYRAREVRETPDGLQLDLRDTYDTEAGVRTLRRSFVLTEEGMKLTDEGELMRAKPVTWIFLLRRKPEWKQGKMTAGNLSVKCPEGLDFSLEEIRMTDARMARSWPESLWRVSLRGGPAKQFRAEFLFSNSAGEE